MMSAAGSIRSVSDMKAVLGSPPRDGNMCRIPPTVEEERRADKPSDS